MPTREQLWWMAIGIATLLIVKYPLLGLKEWNNLLHHCSRKDDPNGLFYYPLMGLLK
jgi:hypothetical protein